MTTDYRYRDIAGYSRPVSRRHKRMSCSDRAAQFAPFAALKGHDEAIAHTAKVAMETDPTYTVIDDPAYIPGMEFELPEEMEDRRIRELNLL